MVSEGGHRMGEPGKRLGGRLLSARLDKSQGGRGWFRVRTTRRGECWLVQILRLEKGVEAGEDAQTGCYNLELKLPVLVFADFLLRNTISFPELFNHSLGFRSRTSAITCGRLAPMPLPVAFLPNGHWL